MLFYYAASAANDNNWLHEWFVASITACFDAVDDGVVVPTWAMLTSSYVSSLANRRVVCGEFYAIVNAYAALRPVERLAVRTALESQIDVACACATGSCMRAADLPLPVAEAAIKFGERLFWLLGVLKVRKAHYRQIWDALPNGANVCPFCALADLDDPGLPAEDLDHYFSRKIYPFSAADLRNLAPMCAKCNMDYKGDKDVLSSVSLERHYPYDVVPPGSVTLDGSRFFANGDEDPPTWQIVLEPQAKAAEWDRIFEIRKRYRLTVLDRRWLNWLEEWAATFPAHEPDDLETIKRMLAVSARNWMARGARDKAFLKAAFYELVRERLEGGTSESRQLLAVLRQQISMGRAAA